MVNIFVIYLYQQKQTIMENYSVTFENGKTFKVVKKGNRFYFFSHLNGRYMPIAKSRVKITVI